MSGAIASTIAAFGVVPFTATGGTFTVNANGYRHHIFNTSGTLTVSGQKAVYVLIQNGGAAGANNSFFDSSVGRGTTGGSGGGVSYLQGTASSNITVTVAAGGGSGSVSGITTSQWLTPTSPSAVGTPRAQSYFGAYQMWYGSIYGGTAGSAGVSHSSKSSIYTGVTNLNTLSGGAGGSGGLVTTGSGGATASPSSGGNIGGGAGGANNAGNGVAGTANSGGGGGGAAVVGAAYGPTSLQTSAGQPGAGGSGYTVISYPI